MSTQPTVSVVIPAKNEAANLALVLPLLPAEYEIVLVDGHSVDSTVAVARFFRPDLVLVNQTRKGKGNALACGFLAASGDIIVMFDADCSADPAEIPRFVQALVDGADFAKGSRFTDGGGSEDITWLRQLGNDGLNLLANLGFGTGFTDLCYGYNAFWRDLVSVLDLPDVNAPAPEDGSMLWGDGFEIETVINCRFAASGARVVEVPSVEKLRVHGESNLNTFRDGFRVLRTIGAEHRRMRAGRRTAASAPQRELLAPRRDLVERTLKLAA
jgi:glycosyltransferase involved in cell wall biosynthesis